jgi:HSP20 family protein
MLYGTDFFSGLRRLQNDIARLSETRGDVAPEFPALNAYVNQDGVIITAELPGVKPADLDISVQRDALTLSGERHANAEEAKGHHRRERPQGRFVRTVSLPFAVDPKRVEAGLKNGVLTLTLLRAEEDKPRRIDVKVI